MTVESSQDVLCVDQGYIASMVFDRIKPHHPQSHLFPAWPRQHARLHGSSPRLRARGASPPNRQDRDDPQLILELGTARLTSWQNTHLARRHGRARTHGVCHQVSEHL